jgi:hypothetical protein
MPGIRPEGFGEVPLAAARDDDFVPELVESLGQATPDARAAAGDEDGVSGEFHIIFFLAAGYNMYDRIDLSKINCCRS